ncbi:MAG: right-handed parallel beta-helix repeat-containing protein, partial [bacterium]|nr:right-handed parallel beta-helix repeat-containing protein [bacterium]
KEFIRISGHIDYDGPADTPVRHIHFQGLTFTHGERDTWDENHKGWGIQHDWELFDRDSALLRFRGAEDCSVEACRFSNSGGTALRLDLHCQRIRIANNLIDYMGSMGILLCGYGPGTKDVNKNNEIVNNLIHHTGEVIWHGHAIFVWQSGSNRMANNCIHHCARKAIGLCGVRITILENRDHTFDEAAHTIRWHEIDKAIAPEGANFDRFMPFLHARDNIVEDNEIYRVLEKIGDGSALNVSGAAEGNLIRRNYAHHIAVHTASSVMRVDDWQRGTTFVDNIIYMCNLGGITRKNFNHIENNMLIDVRMEGYLRFASYPDEKAGYGSRIQRNIFYESGPDVTYYKPAYLASPDVSLPKHCEADHNLFYCAGDPTYSETHIKDMQKDGIEQHSISADPLFEDLENADFRLKPDSPALNLGFQPIDMSCIGLTRDFPEHFRKLDEPEDNSNPEYDRGRNPNKEAYAWW